MSDSNLPSRLAVESTTDSNLPLTTSSDLSGGLIPRVTVETGSNATGYWMEVSLDGEVVYAETSFNKVMAGGTETVTLPRDIPDLSSQYGISAIYSVGRRWCQVYSRGSSSFQASSLFSYNSNNYSGNNLFQTIWVRS